MAGSTLVRVQEKGQVTLPASIRRNLGIKKGDLVAVTESSDGVVITPQKVVALQALDELGQALREQGIDLEEWIESAREERDDLLMELYGMGPDGSH